MNFFGKTSKAKAEAAPPSPTKQHMLSPHPSVDSINADHTHAMAEAQSPHLVPGPALHLRILPTVGKADDPVITKESLKSVTHDMVKHCLDILTEGLVTTDSRKTRWSSPRADNDVTVLQRPSPSPEVHILQAHFHFDALPFFFVSQHLAPPARLLGGHRDTVHQQVVLVLDAEHTVRCYTFTGAPGMPARTLFVLETVHLLDSGYMWVDDVVQPGMVEKTPTEQHAYGPSSDSLASGAVVTATKRTLIRLDRTLHVARSTSSPSDWNSTAQACHAGTVAFLVEQWRLADDDEEDDEEEDEADRDRAETPIPANSDGMKASSAPPSIAPPIVVISEAEGQRETPPTPPPRRSQSLKGSSMSVEFKADAFQRSGSEPTPAASGRVTVLVCCPERTLYQSLRR